jgi:endonuclease-3
MNKKEKAQWIAGKLEELFPDPAIPLQHHSDFTLLVAVLLSAQCTDARVNLVTPELFALADTPEKMATLDVELVKEIIKPCGLYQRKAEAIIGLSEIIVTKHRGKVPDNFAALEALPGVGHKTASVVMSQAFRKPAFPVDTHIHRLAKRWGLSEGKTVEQVEKDLKALFPKALWNKIHLQIIYYARTYCPARGHRDTSCPICHFLGSGVAL